MWLALPWFAPLLLGRAVSVQTDNQAVRAYVNHQGGMCRSLFLLSRMICLWAMRSLLSLTAVYLLGRENGPADSLSRVFPSSVTMCLSPVLFDKIDLSFRLPWLDLFASEEPALLPHFCSLVTSRLAWAIDTFSVPWSLGLPFAFPPFALIPRVLRKVRLDRAEVLLVVPE